MYLKIYKADAHDCILSLYFRDLWDIADKHSSTAENTISATIHSPKKQPIRTKNINKPNPKGETPLHVACLKVCQILIAVLIY